MRRLAATWRGSLPAARSCQPSASRRYSTKDEGPATSKTSTSAEQSHDDFGYNDWSEVNPDTKMIDTVVGPLPISPFLDPSWREARNRNKKKAPPNKAEHTRFQRRMAENPYAQLLAGPVRSCQITRARLPKAFLQDFGLVKSQADELWWIPADFKQEPKEATPETSEDVEARTTNDDSGITMSSDPALNETAPSTKTALSEEPGSNTVPIHPAKSATNNSGLVEAEGQLAANGGGAAIDRHPSRAEPCGTSSAQRDGRFSAPAHTLARRDLLLEFFNKKSKYSSAYMRFAANPSIAGLSRIAAWRQDMDEVIRDQMRRQIVSNLIYLSRLCEGSNRDYLVRMDGKEARTDRHQKRSCFLSFGVEGEPFEVLETEGAPAGACPVYNLQRLLGPENVERLRNESAIFRDVSMLLLRGLRTVELNKKLWRLQGYLADYDQLL